MTVRAFPARSRRPADLTFIKSVPTTWASDEREDDG
jgi:hypothetical protein